MCAVRRRQVDRHHPWSLSPAHLLVAPFVERLVLPSPNGSAIAATVAGQTVIAGCLRNASSVGQWLSSQGFGTSGRPVAVVAAGERWPDGELRPALEDLLGAGSIIAAIDRSSSRSPEATTAEVTWNSHRHQLAETMRSCSSGRELIEAGYPDDVELAAEHDAQAEVPCLIGPAFGSEIRLRPRLTQGGGSAAIRTIRATPGQREDGTRAHTGPGHPIAAVTTERLNSRRHPWSEERW